MIYTRARVEKMNLDDYIKDEILKVGVLDKYDDIQNVLKDILLKLKYPYQKHFYSFLYEMEEIILKNIDFAIGYDKDLFKSLLKIKVINEAEFKQQLFHMNSKKSEIKIDNYSKFIKLIANGKDYSVVYNDDINKAFDLLRNDDAFYLDDIYNSLSLLREKYGLSIDIIEEDYVEDFKNKSSYSKILFGDIEKLNDDILLILTQESSNNPCYCTYVLYVLN